MPPPANNRRGRDKLNHGTDTQRIETQVVASFCVSQFIERTPPTSAPPLLSRSPGPASLHTLRGIDCYGSEYQHARLHTCCEPEEMPGASPDATHCVNSASFARAQVRS